MKWPQIPRPWNPAYTETYDAMTEAERQNSFKIDLALLVVVLFVCATLGGCSRVDDGADTRPTAAKASGGTSLSPREVEDYYDEEEERASRDAGMGVRIDRATGCHYLGSTAYTITPRMSRIENGRQYQVGCYVEDVVMKDPVP